MVAVDDEHQLYTQLWGNQDSEQRIVFLHGGPGSGTSERAKTLFDPQKHQVLFFDQRGAGQSTPMGELHNNTTEHLVNDIEQLRQRVGWELVELVGNSWGSCLSLTYGLAHPDRVKRMVLGGVFTGTTHEVDFIDAGRVRSHFPDVWDQYRRTVPESFKDNPSAYHIQRILGDNLDEAKESSAAYVALEDAVSSITVPPLTAEPIELSDADFTANRIEMSYFLNKCYLPAGFILDRAAELTMPIEIIQGRFDMACPPETAFNLARAAVNATLHFTQAGHSVYDAANFEMYHSLI